MQALTVVERLDVVEDVRLGLRPRTVAGAMHPLILQAVEEALRGHIIPTITLTAHRAQCALC